MEKTLEKELSEDYKLFLAQIEEKKKLEEKLRFTLDYMKKILSEGNPPSFRDFWTAKRLCLELFKEKLTPHVREVFWQEYTFLSDEARQVKNVLDEQSAFAHEQLVLALDSIEQDYQDFDNKLNDLPSIEVPEELKDHQAHYSFLQKDIDLLNAFGERIVALRKELIQTSMRIKLKNRLFERLKVLGDQVFPLRKEKSDEMARLFKEDVDTFLNTSVLEPKSYFKEKEKIKTLQKFAKTIALSPTTFAKTRELLSHHWDKIKDLETAFRQEKAEEKAQVQTEVNKIAPQVEILTQECKEEKISLKEADEKVGELLTQMRELKLPKDLEKKWKRQILDAKKPLEEKERLLRQKEKEEEEKEWIAQLENQDRLLKTLTDLITQAETLSLEILVEKWELALKEEKTLKTTGVQRLLVTHRLDTVGDIIQEKRWQSLLDNEGEGEDLIPQIRSLLNERHKEKRKIKVRLEDYRKLIGGSSLTLEQSMLYQEMVSDNKLRLETIETLLEELEEKLFDLED